MNVQQLSYKHHKNGPHFFQDLTFELSPGKIHALHGKNGVGKSILLQLLSGQHFSGSQVTGRINVQGGVAIVNQRFDQMIADEFTFAENLLFSKMTRFPKPFAALQPSPHLHSQLCNKFHIDMNLPVKMLSGGQRQILALMMALQRPVQWLLLDEPTATLDEQNAAMVFEFLRSISDRTFLVVCHDRELIREYANGIHLRLELDEQSVRRLAKEGY
jgi:ABC-type multidrug transport system ATPase subunit